MTNTVRWRGVFEDRVSGPLDKIRDRFDQLGKSKGAASILQGVGLGVGVSAWNAVGTAVSKAGDFFLDSIAAARDAEVSQFRLNAALKANVDGWTGNTDAIDKAIRARQKLAFDDEELQDSLALLLPATRDVNEALTLQSAAMDFARFKGISLKEASEALIRVEAGQFRMLRSLGVELRDGATQTEALAAVQALAAGQAEAYGRTNAAAAERASVAWENLQEMVGSFLLPKVTELSDAFTTVTNAVTDMTASIDGSGGLTDAVGKFGDMVANSFRPDKVIGFAQTAGEAIKDFFVAPTRDAVEIGQELADTVRDDWRIAFNDAGDHMEGLADRVSTQLDDIVTDFETARQNLTRIGQQAGDAAYGPLITAGELAANAREQAEQRQVIASKESTAEQVADAKLRLAELQAARLSLMGEAAAHGGALSQQQSQFMSELQRQWSTSIGDQSKRIQRLIQELTNLRLAALQATGALRAGAGIGMGSGGRASGGPVWPGIWTVGERGPETLVLGSGRGFVIPSGGQAGGHPAGGAVAFTYAPTYSTASPAEAQRFSEAVLPGLVRELRRQRVLP